MTSGLSGLVNVFKLNSQNVYGKIQIRDSYCMCLEYFFEENLVIITG